MAKRLLEKYHLEPPINVKKLVRYYANVKFTGIPFDVDGVSLNLKVSGKTPHIIVNTIMPTRRQRFTLAHELGHVIIPWHIGSIIDKIDHGFHLHRPHNNYRLMEMEANRFAAELLMPSAWINSLLQGNFIPIDVHRTIVYQAEVSPVAASIKLIGDLPSGYIFCALGEDGEVQFSGRSPGTIANAPPWESVIDPDNLYPYCEAVYRKPIMKQDFIWWKISRELNIPSQDDPRNWRELLDDILDDMSMVAEDKNNFRQSVNGVVASANSMAKRSDGYSEKSIYSAAIQRFHSNEKYGLLITHNDFPTFLQKRAYEMFQRNQSD